MIEFECDVLCLYELAEIVFKGAVLGFLGGALYLAAKDLFR